MWATNCHELEAGRDPDTGRTTAEKVYFGVPCSSRQVNLRPLQVGLPLTKPHIDIRVGCFTISPLATARVIYYVIRVVIRWTASLSQPGRVKRFALWAPFSTPPVQVIESETPERTIISGSCCYCRRTRVKRYINPKFNNFVELPYDDWSREREIKNRLEHYY